MKNNTNPLEKPQSTVLTKAVSFLLRIIRWGLSAIFPLFVLMLLIDLGTSYLVEDRIFTNINTLPKRESALVLGTAKFYPSGNPNLYYKYRLEAVQQLYLTQKVEHFLVSGDNKTPYYNEPKMMISDLLKMGLPTKQMTPDYAGYNTLDSVIRADKVFKLKPFTIVSQRFHCERALLIAKFHNIDAICFVAKYPEQHYKVRIREFIARSAMVFNLLIGTQATKLDQ